MTRVTSPAPAAGRRGLHGWRRWLAHGFQLVVGVQTVLVFAQAVSAGQFLSGRAAWLEYHELAGTALLGATTIVQLLLGLGLGLTRGPWWPAAVSVVVLGVLFAQTDAGFAGRLGLHVPLGVAILLGLVGMLVASRHLTAPGGGGGGRR